MNVMGLNTLDLLIIVILLIGTLIGLTRGALSQIVSAVSIWLALVTTLWLYRIFSFRILQGLGLGRTASDTLAFIILLIVLFNAFRLIVRYLTKPPEEKKKRKKHRDDPLAEAAKSASERAVGVFQVLGGMVMGLILTSFWLTIYLAVIQFSLQTVTTGGLVSNIRTSTLVPIFNGLLRALVISVDLFVPRNADILKAVLSRIMETG
jgi:hypothetical protein